MRRQIAGKRWVLASLVGLLCVAILVFPTSRFLLFGWIRGESFYGGRPTSDWHREIHGYDEHWFPLSQDWYLSRPVSSGLVGWWRKLCGFDEQATIGVQSPLLSGDPEALHVLMELLQYPDNHSRRVGAYGLGKIGTQARSAVPTLSEIARTTDDSALYFLARCTLGSIAPEANAAAGLERPMTSMHFRLQP